MEADARRREGHRLRAFLLLFLLCSVTGFAALRSMPLQKIANQQHANSKHARAPTIRRAHRKGLCHRLEAYVSGQRGTLLVLCKMEEGSDAEVPWGGLVWRVLEKREGALALLGPDELYECTVFAADRSYWNRVIARDGYVKAADTRWYKPLSWLIFP